MDSSIRLCVCLHLMTHRIPDMIIMINLDQLEIEFSCSCNVCIMMSSITVPE